MNCRFDINTNTVYVKATSKGWLTKNKSDNIQKLKLTTSNSLNGSNLFWLIANGKNNIKPIIYQGWKKNRMNAGEKKVLDKSELCIEELA